MSLLRDAFDRYVRSRPPRRKLSGMSVPDARHRQMMHTWLGAGNGLYFHIWACMECRYGYVHALLPDHEDVPDARELGILRKKEWPLDCPVVLKEIAEAGEQAKLALPD